MQVFPVGLTRCLDLVRGHDVNAPRNRIGVGTLLEPLGEFIHILGDVHSGSGGLIRVSRH